MDKNFLPVLSNPKAQQAVSACVQQSKKGKNPSHGSAAVYFFSKERFRHAKVRKRKDSAGQLIYWIENELIWTSEGWAQVTAKLPISLWKLRRERRRNLQERNIFPYH